MSTRTITGNLAADPEVVPAGSIQITKLRVIENTGEYRGDQRVEGLKPLTHSSKRSLSWALGPHRRCTRATP